MRDEPTTPDDRLTRLARRHYRPEPMTPGEASALLARVRARAAAERSGRHVPRLGWGGAASTAAACAIALYIGTLDARSPDRTSAATDTGPTADRAVDGLLIPSEAYAIDTDAWAQQSLPADYQAIDALLLR